MRYDLPKASRAGTLSLEETLRERRSMRNFAVRPLSLQAAAQLLWAAQGVSSPEGLRTAPSAGALYPLELHLVVGEVAGLAPGSYRYDAPSHRLAPMAEGDLRLALADAALGQSWIAKAPAAVVIAGVYSRTQWKYGQRGIRYVHVEAGHAAQNLALQAVAMGLGSTVVGAFDDTALQGLLGLPANEQPLVILPVGYPE